MQYFKNRSEAGKLLADKLAHYGNENCAVLAVSEGGVIVGAEIARKLRASLYMLATEDITLPRENSPIATMSSAGTFTYNPAMSESEIDAMNADYRTVIDQDRMEAFQHLNRIIGKDGEIKKALLKRHVVILVSDGFEQGLALNVVADFLKPIMIKKLVVATPIASVPAVDRMHIMADEIICLGVVHNYLSTPHYYEEQDVPDHKTVVEIMKNIVLTW